MIKRGNRFKAMVGNAPTTPDHINASSTGRCQWIDRFS
jgi:hypothetical protein